MHSRRNYAKAPLVEALCEFHFGATEEWDWTIPGLLYAELEARFPTRQQSEEVEIQVHEDLKNVRRRSSNRLRFLSPDEKRLIQVGPNVLVANCLDPYPGWAVFREIIEDALEKYARVAKPKQVALVALRYINKINVPQEGAILEDYLKAIPQVPAGIPDTLVGWALSLNIPFRDEEGMLLLKAGSVYEEEKGSFLLDLSFVAANPAKLGLGDSLLEWIQTAHDKIEETFEASITDKARSLFQEELSHDQLSARQNA